MNLKEIGCGNVDWIPLSQGREHWRAVGNTVTEVSMKDGKFLDYLSNYSFLKTEYSP
jgi:hypothetical protein